MIDLREAKKEVGMHALYSLPGVNVIDVVSWKDLQDMTDTIPKYRQNMQNPAPLNGMTLHLSGRNYWNSGTPE